MLVTMLFASCTVRAPWADEPVGQEVNVAFTMRQNLIVLPSVTVDGRPGRYLLSASQPRTLIDARFAQSLGAPLGSALQLNEKEALQFQPVTLDPRGAADAIIGADVWGHNAISIDYAAGLVTFQREGIHPGLMTLFRYTNEPSVFVTIDGRKVPAIVDTTSPDTLVLPRGSDAAARRKARVGLAGTDFGDVDVYFTDVAQARVGNRLLSKFLVSIDYGKREVGLWRDPRIAL